MMHEASEMQVLVARERRINLLLVRERGRGLLFHECLRDGDGVVAFRAKDKPRLLISQGR